MKNFPLALTNAAVGFPARVCVITRTDGTVYRVAESDEAITVSGDVYAVIPGLQISAVKHTSNGEMPSCQIVAVHASGATFETEDLEADLFKAATVQIYIVDRQNLSTKGLLFTGSISTISYNVENQVVFDVMGPSQFARRLMTQKRSPMCRTDLFSTLCGVDETAYDVATTIDEVTNAFNFTVTGSLAQANGYFNQGVAVFADGRGIRISNWIQSTQTITTYLPLRLTAGASLTLYPGCDKTLGATGCAKFSNQLNFQGEPHFLGTAAAAQQVSGSGPTGTG
jgi:uncharacterized phage protein (TIGR02218 family)